MISKHDILAMARHIARRGDGYPDRRIIHPVRDWLIGFFTSAVLFVVGVLGAGYLFLTKSEQVVHGRPIVLEVTKYDDTLIERVRTTYQEREATVEALRGTTPAVSVETPPEEDEEETENVSEGEALDVF